MKSISAFNKIKSNEALVPYLLMILGMGLFLVSNGKWIIPIFTWIAPVFLIRAFRNFKRWYGRFFFFVLVVIVHSIRFKGMIPAPGVLYFMIIFSGCIFIV